MAKPEPHDGRPARTATVPAPKATRLAREAAALRANLHKRKDQARERAQAADGSAPPAGDEPKPA
jgi:hypothetical protein